MENEPALSPFFDAMGGMADYEGFSEHLGSKMRLLIQERQELAGEQGGDRTTKKTFPAMRALSLAWRTKNRATGLTQVIHEDEAPSVAEVVDAHEDSSSSSSCTSPSSSAGNPPPHAHKMLSFVMCPMSIRVVWSGKSRRRKSLRYSSAPRAQVQGQMISLMQPCP